MRNVIHIIFVDEFNNLGYTRAKYENVPKINFFRQLYLKFQYITFMLKIEKLF